MKLAASAAGKVYLGGNVVVFIRGGCIHGFTYRASSS
jgi:hypothetical protein